MSAPDLIFSVMALAVVGIVRQPSKRRDRNDQALCDAASIGDLSLMSRLLADGSSPDSADEDGTTALMSAAFAGQAKAVRALLASGADPDLQDVAGLTALMNAVISAGEADLDALIPVFTQIVELLLEAGADPTLEDEDGCTAWDHARTYRLIDLEIALDDA